MNLINRLLPFLIGVCFLANFLPSTLEHVFGEKHEHDSHVCDSDFCFQEEEVDCETIVLADNKKFTPFPKKDHTVFLSGTSYQEYNFSPFTFRLSREIRLRGPPIIV